VDHDDRERLRQTFDEVAELYDRARPPYPSELLTGLQELTGIGPGSRVLEIGCGTGQLSVPLAGLGVRLTAVELGAGMAAVARRNLAPYADAQVVTSAFEAWPLPAVRFDLVVSATAFHWIDPAVRVSKSAEALRSGGILAVIDTHHVAGGDEQFWTESHPCYERWDPTAPPPGPMQRREDLPLGKPELEESARLEPAQLRRYEWDVTYPTADYLDLLRTYSGHRALADEARRGLLACLGDVVEASYGGRVTKRYLAELRVARVRP